MLAHEVAQRSSPRFAVFTGLDPQHIDRAVTDADARLGRPIVVPRNFRRNALPSMRGRVAAIPDALEFPALEYGAKAIAIESYRSVMTKISIVVPCFNQEEFIAETLESVLSQSYGDWECIIVNDGSTDGSEGIIQRYAKNDRRFLPFTKANGGVAAARNFGFSQATGTLFVPLDGDDKIHPDFLKRAAECFAEHPDTDLVHCKTKRIGESNKIWRLPEYSYEKLLWQNMIVNTTMYRREGFFRIGGYSSEMIHGFEDWEFYVRLLSPQSKVRFVDAPLYLYRVKKSSRSTELVALGKVEESQRLIYTRNRAAYEPFLDNPISVFGQRMKEFAPFYASRYRRQVRYMHMAYAGVIVGLLVAGAFLLHHH